MQSSCATSGTRSTCSVHASSRLSRAHSIALRFGDEEAAHEIRVLLDHVVAGDEAGRVDREPGLDERKHHDLFSRARRRLVLVVVVHGEDGAASIFFEMSSAAMADASEFDQMILDGSVPARSATLGK